MAKKSDFEKIVKKTDGRVFLYLVCFVLAAVMGYLVLSMFTKNDTFMMVNYASSDKVDCVLNMGDEYVEYGAQCVSFGKESEVKITYHYRVDEYNDCAEVEKIDTLVAGIYYVKYTCEDFKYSNIELVRVVEVLEQGGDL